eukprot:CAMPEP_0202905790 /NCGR_PEP_ID=MMETSP1392-20130828/36055_1 /ASSEMBLY_ACC=CAM_ASM_000868 /TAXON_ID=225041 /ORGANISM="Chlamydomonas chlamydogama, Strain SAG 11-48b" /LENGTH=46 /DNA_ID= /DNA_START= /DNA_END= /DNA_ORIENTATION=
MTAVAIPTSTNVTPFDRPFTPPAPFLPLSATTSPYSTLPSEEDLAP